MINSEKDVVKILNEIIRWYKENLPMSPVPVLLSNALELVGKDFLEAVTMLSQRKYPGREAELMLKLRFYDKSTGKELDITKISTANQSGNNKNQISDNKPGISRISH